MTKAQQAAADKLNEMIAAGIAAAIPSIIEAVNASQQPQQAAAQPVKARGKNQRGRRNAPTSLVVGSTFTYVGTKSKRSTLHTVIEVSGGNVITDQGRTFPASLLVKLNGKNVTLH